MRTSLGVCRRAVCTAVRAREAGRAALVILLSVALLLGAGGYAAYASGWLDRLLGEPRPADVAPAAVAPPAGVQVPSAVPPRPVLASLDGATGAPAPAELRRHVADSLRDNDFGRHLGVLVQTVGGDRDLLRVGGRDRFVPASTMKLLTATAALGRLAPRHRFATTVVRGRGRREIVLVGGGDPLLTQRRRDASTYPRPATLRALARKCAQRLRKDDVRRVRLGYDSSLFTGPAVNPHWEPDYVPDDVVSPITALWVDGGRVEPGLAARSTEPARAAAGAFAVELERAGIQVRGAPTPAGAPPGRQPIASVESPTLAQIVQYVMETSDNETAEVLLRHVALAAGRRGTSAAGTQALRATLQRLGVDLSRAVIHDGSGLSRSNRLTTDTLVQVLQVAASPAQPDLRRVVSGLPVAGFNGSLAYRFDVQGTDGRGLVRAKTGTLSRVHALAGVTVDRDGSPLVFVAVADRVRLVDTLGARAALDALAADLARCCR